jgi:hypothetical protein
MAKDGHHAALLVKLIQLDLDHRTRLKNLCCAARGGIVKANGTAGAVPNCCEKLVYRAQRVLRSADPIKPKT